MIVSGQPRRRARESEAECGVSWFLWSSLARRWHGAAATVALPMRPVPCRMPCRGSAATAPARVRKRRSPVRSIAPRPSAETGTAKISRVKRRQAAAMTATHAAMTSASPLMNPQRTVRRTAMYAAITYANVPTRMRSAVMPTVIAGITCACFPKTSGTARSTAPCRSDPGALQPILSPGIVYFLGFYGCPLDVLQPVRDAEKRVAADDLFDHDPILAGRVIDFDISPAGVLTGGKGLAP